MNTGNDDRNEYHPSDEFRYVNIIRIRVVDERGRTRCYLSKRTYFDEFGAVDYSESWSAPSKPLRDRPDGVPFQKGRSPQSPIHRSGDHLNLELPGLVINLEKLSPKLDRFAAAMGLADESGAAIVCNDNDADTPTLTTEQLGRMHS